MVELAKSMADSSHPAEATLIISNVPAAGGIAKAQNLGITTKIVDHRPFKGDRSAFEAELDVALKEANIDIICLAGFMRILTSDFIAKWQGKMLNTHPAILPLFKGLNTHQRAIDAGMCVHGCTVHEVTSELDGGPILGQAVIPIAENDTADDLASRILPLEHKLYPEVLRKFAVGDRTKVTLFP